MESVGCENYSLHLCVLGLVAVAVVMFAVAWGNGMLEAVPEKDFRGLVAYDIHQNKTQAEFEDWLWNQHFPDLLENPHLNKISQVAVVDKQAQLSNGQVFNASKPFSHMTMLHFTDAAAYDNYIQFFIAYPIPASRSSALYCATKFYVLGQTQEVLKSSIALGKSYRATRL